MGIGHSKEARSTNFVFNIGVDRELSFSVQTSNVTDVTLGETLFMSGAKDIKLPSNKITNAPLVVDFLLSEDLSEWVEIYKWLLTAKNSGFTLAQRPCDLIVLDSQNQTVVTFNYTDVFPIEITGLQYAINTDNSTVMTFTATFSFNRFKVITKEGLVIDEQYTS